MKLEGKVALVTGSSQGIGQSIVLRLAQAGADVVINYRSHPEGAEETLAKVQAMSGRCHMAQCLNAQGYTIQAALGGVAEVHQLIAESIAHFGKLDILVNNAGVEKHPQDVASVVAFLVSADADNITGSTFVVDGRLLWNYQEQ